MTTISKNIQQIKAIYPNWFAKAASHYNFCHEIRESQKHIFFRWVKQFCTSISYRSYCTGAVEKVCAQIDEYIQSKKEEIERIMNSQIASEDTKLTLTPCLYNSIEQCEEAKKFISEFPVKYPTK